MPRTPQASIRGDGPVLPSSGADSVKKRGGDAAPPRADHPQPSGLPQPHDTHRRDADSLDAAQPAVETLALPLIPGYELIREIGRGLFSAVYEARRVTNPSTVVALKILWPADEAQQARFEREVRVLRELDSPYIVKCHDAGRCGTMVYYAMTLVRGLPLDEYLARHAPTLDEKLAVFRRVCEGVAEAHAQGVAHRDLKPSNILVEPDGTPRLLDFGLCAVEFGDWSTGMRRRPTLQGDVMGTVRYMSPEQAWGGLLGGPVDWRTDVWALGVMLYEIATGNYPFDIGPAPGKSADEALLFRIRTESPRPPVIPPGPHAAPLRQLIERCLAWDRAHRLDSVKTLADDVGRCIENRPLASRPLSRAYRLRRLATAMAVRQRTVLRAVIVTFAMLTISIAAHLTGVRWRQQSGEFGGAPPIAGLGDNPDGGPFTLIGITDECIRRVPREISAHGVTGDIRTWRTLHGRLMQRLAATPPRAVAWDFYFRTPQAGDDEFAEGLLALHRAGTPVILAVQQFEPDGRPQISPDLYERVRDAAHFGMILARDMERRPGEFVLGLRRENDVFPSLALSIVAAVRHPQHRLVIDWTQRERRLFMAYENRSRPGVVLRGRDAVPLTAVYEQPDNALGARRGDLLACRAFDMTQPETWQRHVISFADALAAGDDELRQWTAGRIVIIGDLRTGGLLRRADRHSVRYGSRVARDVPGCFLLADAVNGMFAHTALQRAFPMGGDTFVLLAVAALCSCFVAAPLARWTTGRASRTVLIVALAAIVVAGAFTAMESETRPIVVLGLTAACLGLALPPALWIEWTRERFRVQAPPVEQAAAPT